MPVVPLEVNPNASVPLALMVPTVRLIVEKPPTEIPTPMEANTAAPLNLVFWPISPMVLMMFWNSASMFERFVALMVTFGQNSDGIEVVELEAGSSAAKQRRSRLQNASDVAHTAKLPARVN